MDRHISHQTGQPLASPLTLAICHAIAHGVEFASPPSMRQLWFHTNNLRIFQIVDNNFTHLTTCSEPVSLINTHPSIHSGRQSKVFKRTSRQYSQLLGTTASHALGKSSSLFLKFPHLHQNHACNVRHSPRMAVTSSNRVSRLTLPI